MFKIKGEAKISDDKLTKAMHGHWLSTAKNRGKTTEAEERHGSQVHEKQILLKETNEKELRRN